MKFETKKGRVNKAPMGVKPMTTCSLDRRSNQLRYSAKPDLAG